MTSRLIIKSHRPGHLRIWVLLLLLLLLIAGWALVEYGRSQAEIQGGTLQDELNEVQSELALAQAQNAALSERIAILERATQVDKQAYSEVERSLKLAQDEKLELKEEVAFYRGIFSPAESSSGLNIAEFKLRTIGEDRAYRFKLVLTQTNANDVDVRGYSTITLEGVNSGSQVQLDLSELTGGALKNLAFRFKYFQNYEGEIVLPEGFLPSRVVVAVNPSSKGFSALKKTFDWSDIIK